MGGSGPIENTVVIAFALGLLPRLWPRGGGLIFKPIVALKLAHTGAYGAITFV